MVRYGCNFIIVWADKRQFCTKKVYIHVLFHLICTFFNTYIIINVCFWIVERLYLHCIDIYCLYEAQCLKIILQFGQTKDSYAKKVHKNMEPKIQVFITCRPVHCASIRIKLNFNNINA